MEKRGERLTKRYRRETRMDIRREEGDTD